MIRSKLLTKKGFVDLFGKTLKTLKLDLPSALWKGGEAQLINIERAT